MRPRPRAHERTWHALGMRAEEVTFTGTGGETLVGTFDLLGKEPEGYARMAHCFT